MTNCNSELNSKFKLGFGLRNESLNYFFLKHIYLPKDIRVHSNFLVASTNELNIEVTKMVNLISQLSLLFIFNKTIEWSVKSLFHKNTTDNIDRYTSLD